MDRWVGRNDGKRRKYPEGLAIVYTRECRLCSIAGSSLLVMDRGLFLPLELCTGSLYSRLR